jgi:PAS domain S-box-containing protein
MILNWIQKMGAAKTALAITVLSILAALALEIGMSSITGHLHAETIIKCIVFPAIIAPIISYAIVRVAVMLSESEAALRESEKKYRTILDNIEDGYFEVDLEGNFTDFNDALCRLIGYSAMAMAGMNNREYMDEENANWEITKVDGSKSHVDASVSLITNPEGNPIGFRGIARDVTAQKQSQSDLRESEAKYRQLVNHAPAGIYEVDFIEGKFVNVNDLICEYTGYTRQELLAMSALDILAEDSQKKFLERLDKILKGQKIPSSVEFKIRAKSGREFSVLINSKIIYGADGKPKGATAVVHDITEQKQAEEEKKNLEYQLQQAQKMEAIGTLAGGIAHDFNNILSVIIGYTELILMNGDVAGEVRQNLKEIFSASKHARDMVKQILAFSRQNKQERKPIQVAHIAKEAIKMLRASLPTTISIQHHIAKDTGVIEADPTQIHQVLMNLCTNAAHAINEKDGVLEIHLGNIDLDQKAAADIPGLKTGSYLKLSVKDSGEGIHPEVQQHIFNPYFTTKEKGEGTGLGLAVVQGIVKSNKGAVTVESEVGKGTAFHVYLPTINRKLTPDDEISTPLPLGCEHILLVDDEQPLVEIGRQMLERLGYSVATRTSSIEALELFKVDPNRFDLVITDIVMPNLTGDKLAKKIINIRSDIPVVLCTGYSEKFTRQNASEMGIVSFLMKPLVMRDLANTVRQALAAN